MIKKTIALFAILISNFSYSQDDLLKELDVKPSKKEIETAAFKAMQICTMQSTKIAAKGELYVLISHRFGDLTNGLDNFFGLDNALTKIGGLYGINNSLTLGFSRQTYQKTYEFTAKYKLFNQEVDGFPVTIVGFNSLQINSEFFSDEFP